MLTTGQLRALPLAEAAHAFNLEVTAGEAADRWRRRYRSQRLADQDARLERCAVCPAADAPVFFRGTRNRATLAGHMARVHPWAEVT